MLEQEKMPLITTLIFGCLMPLQVLGHRSQILKEQHAKVHWALALVTTVMLVPEQMAPATTTIFGNTTR